MTATAVIDKNRMMIVPESICEAADFQPNDQIEWRVENGEIRGRKLIGRQPAKAFPRGSLRKYLTPKRDKEQLAIVNGCVQGPAESE